MAKKFIKTIYVVTHRYFGDNATPERIDLYESDCFIFCKATTIRNEVYERKDKKESNWYKYSTAKQYLETEFDQNLCDEFERQSTEYRKKVMHDAEQSVAKKEVEARVFLFNANIRDWSEGFKGDWVEFAKKIKTKLNEMSEDFLKFMKDNNN